MLKDLQVTILGNYENFKVEIGEWKKRWIWCGHWQNFKSQKKETPSSTPKIPPKQSTPQKSLSPCYQQLPNREEEHWFHAGTVL